MKMHLCVRTRRTLGVVPLGIEYGGLSDGDGVARVRVRRGLFRGCRIRKLAEKKKTESWSDYVILLFEYGFPCQSSAMSGISSRLVRPSHHTSLSEEAISR